MKIIKAMLNFFRNIWLYLIIFALLFMLLYTNNIIYFKSDGMSITIGISDKYDLMTLDEQIEATHKAVNDKELESILKDARNRGYFDD